MSMETARLLASPEGVRLLTTIRRLVRSQGLPTDVVVRQSVEHMERLEAVAQRAGKTVKEVADEALDLYEARLGRGPLDFLRERNL
jgi:hypothetical protein